MSFAVVPVLQATDEHSLVPTEQANIQVLQPRLNYPFICKWFMPSKGILRRVPIQRIDGHHKAKGFQTIVRKVRRGRLPARCKIMDLTSIHQKIQLWTLVCDLGSNTLRRFDAEKRIRSRDFAIAQCYVLHRLARLLPPNMAPSASRAIRDAVQYRGGILPQLARPLRARLSWRMKNTAPTSDD